MSTIVIEGLSPRALAAWERRARREKRTIADAMRAYVEDAPDEGPVRMPMYIPSTEITAPCDLPYESEGVSVTAVDGGKRWPDRPITEDDFR